MATVYSAGDFRNGTTFEMDGNVYRIVEFQHVKPGKGSAFVRTKLKNVISGAVIEKTFNPSEKYPAADGRYLHIRYPRPGRSAFDVRHGCGHGQRPHSADRHAAGYL